MIDTQGFSIDNNGVFTIDAGTLDYETAQSYLFNVSATDSGSPARSALAQVRIGVRDLNDTSPVFESTSYTTDIDEGDYTLSTPVLQVVRK